MKRAPSPLEQIVRYLAWQQQLAARCTTKHTKLWKPKTCMRCRIAGYRFFKSMGWAQKGNGPEKYGKERNIYE